MQYRLARMAIALLCILTGAISASAQITTGVVSGALKDEQGAVVPGATVTLVSDTRGTRVADAHTNENGDFVFPNVPGIPTRSRSRSRVSRPCAAKGCWSARAIAWSCRR